MTIFFASQNQGKIAEAFDLFMASGHQLFTFNDQNLLKAKGIIFPNDFSIEESGATLAENALLKAKAVAEISQLPTLADDSGLLLDAFPGFPGVKSNRWHEGSDQDRNRALLKKL